MNLVRKSLTLPSQSTRAHGRILYPVRRQPRVEFVPPGDRAHGGRPDLPARLPPRAGSARRRPDADKRPSPRGRDEGPEGPCVLRRAGLAGSHPRRYAAVGTNTLRMAKNAKDFLNRAEAALGLPIEVVAGREEARLIYLGVAQPARSLATGGWWLTSAAARPNSSSAAGSVRTVGKPVHG